MVDSFPAGRCRRHDRVDARPTDHAVQSTDAAHDGDLLPDASLVSARDAVWLTRHPHAHDRAVVWRTMVESRLHAAPAPSDIRRDLDGAPESLRVDVQSTAESRVRESC